MKKVPTPKKVIQRSAFANPTQEAVQGNSRLANPIDPRFRPEAPELIIRRNTRRNQG